MARIIVTVLDENSVAETKENIATVNSPIQDFSTSTVEA